MTVVGVMMEVGAVVGSSSDDADDVGADTALVAPSGGRIASVSESESPSVPQARTMTKSKVTRTKLAVNR
ncbi:MAG: hypothetical protein M3439_05635 [Chloroflexota bacterium]|nr:hypothetical protein [Chloroflexota bacterium]